MSQEAPPCPACGGTDFERITNHDAYTGTDSFLEYCQGCSMCAPPSVWTRPIHSARLAYESRQPGSVLFKIREEPEKIEHIGPKTGEWDWIAHSAHYAKKTLGGKVDAQDMVGVRVRKEGHAVD